MPNDDIDVSRLIGGLEARSLMTEQRVATLEKEIWGELRLVRTQVGDMGRAVTQLESTGRTIAWIVGIWAVVSLPLLEFAKLLLHL